MLKTRIDKTFFLVFLGYVALNVLQLFLHLLSSPPESHILSLKNNNVVTLVTVYKKQKTFGEDLCASGSGSRARHGHNAAAVSLMQGHVQECKAALKQI